MEHCVCEIFRALFDFLHCCVSTIPHRSVIYIHMFRLVLLCWSKIFSPHCTCVTKSFSEISRKNLAKWFTDWLLIVWWLLMSKLHAQIRWKASEYCWSHCVLWHMHLASFWASVDLVLHRGSSSRPLFSFHLSEYLNLPYLINFIQSSQWQT